MANKRMSIAKIERAKQELRAKEAKKALAEQIPLWDHLNQLAATMQNMIYSHMDVYRILQDNELKEMIVDKQSLGANIRQLVNDLNTFKERYLNVYNQHKNNTGQPTDPEAIMEATNLHLEYGTLAQEYEGIIIPVVSVIIEQIGEAERLLTAKRQQEAESAVQTENSTGEDCPADENN